MRVIFSDANGIVANARMYMGMHHFLTEERKPAFLSTQGQGRKDAISAIISKINYKGLLLPEYMKEYAVTLHHAAALQAPSNAAGGEGSKKAAASPSSSSDGKAGKASGAASPASKRALSSGASPASSKKAKGAGASSPAASKTGK